MVERASSIGEPHASLLDCPPLERALVRFIRSLRPAQLSVATSATLGAQRVDALLTALCIPPHAAGVGHG